jgi:cytochrome c-type biogenesis protein CcmF
VLVFARRKNGEWLTSRAAAVIMLITAFFVVLVILVPGVAHPFLKLAIPPADGAGLNPALENPGMLIHPIVLIAGYAAFAVPFALAMAALLARRVDGEWVIVARRWALIAWLLLGLGNLIGAWWAYVELGWGGYWGWDPVENSSLMPWLVATAFLHSLSMQRRRGIFKNWSPALIALVFNLITFGALLNRSNILHSVHSFAYEGLGPYFPYFIVFIVVSVVIPVGLMISRRGLLASVQEPESLVSRESAFMLTNLLFVGATLIVLIGTLFPWISRTLGGSEVGVSASFYDRVNGPLFLVIVLLSGVCTSIGWRRASGRNLARNLLLPAGVAVALTAVLVIIGMRGAAAVITSFIGAFVVGTIVYEWVRGILARMRTQRERVFRAFWMMVGMNRPRYGGYIVHLGMVLLTIGVVGSSIYGVEEQTTLKPGESLAIGGYVVTYDGLRPFQTVDRAGASADVSFSKNGKSFGAVAPMRFLDKYFNFSPESPVTEVAIKSTPVEDLYVILLGWDSDESAALKVLVNPLVMWIWIGGGVLTVGGLIAFWPERRRVRAATAGGLDGIQNELESDYRTGIISKDEFDSLRPVGGSGKQDDDIERRVQALRRQKQSGNRPSGGEVRPGGSGGPKPASGGPRAASTCPKCGRPTKEGARFCTVCGASLGGGKK